MEHECCNLAELEKLRADNSAMKALLKTIFIDHPQYATGYIFICGTFGETPDDGLPEQIAVCPQYGSDIVGVYTKTSVTGPEF